MNWIMGSHKPKKKKKKWRENSGGTSLLSSVLQQTSDNWVQVSAIFVVTISSNVQPVYKLVLWSSHDPWVGVVCQETHQPFTRSIKTNDWDWIQDILFFFKMLLVYSCRKIYMYTYINLQEHFWSQSLFHHIFLFSASHLAPTDDSPLVPFAAQTMRQASFLILSFWKETLFFFFFLFPRSTVSVGEV